jgi:hypothetical protein
VTVHNEAVGLGPGALRLWTNGCSLSATGYVDDLHEPEAIPIDVPLVDLNEVIRRVGGSPVDLLKIDTEGAEADTLEAASPATLNAVQQVVLEYHLRRCPDSLLRCKKVLERAGFQCLIHPVNDYHGLIYAWRTDSNR